MESESPPRDDTMYVERRQTDSSNFPYTPRFPAESVGHIFDSAHFTVAVGGLTNFKPTSFSCYVLELCSYCPTAGDSNKFYERPRFHRREVLKDRRTVVELLTQLGRGKDSDGNPAVENQCVAFSIN